MVHTLRDRKICTSSPDCSLLSLNLVTTPPLITSRVNSSKEVIASHSSHLENQHLTKDVTTKEMDKTAFAVTLGVRIDEIIFQQTFKRFGGISLFAIKKHLNEEYHYNSHRYRRLIRNYIVESLANGNLQQASGKGASGSVRLSNNKHRKFARARVQQRSINVQILGNNTLPATLNARESNRNSNKLVKRPKSVLVGLNRRNVSAADVAALKPVAMDQMESTTLPNSTSIFSQIY